VAGAQDSFGTSKRMKTSGSAAVTKHRTAAAFGLRGGRRRRLTNVTVRDGRTRENRYMPEPLFDEWIAQRYESLWPELFEPAVVEPAVSFLAGLAGTGPALELGIGTGRIAPPLHRRGVRVVCSWHSGTLPGWPDSSGQLW
jgi:hypothetical protein